MSCLICVGVLVAFILFKAHLSWAFSRATWDFMIHPIPFLHNAVLHTCWHVAGSDELSEGNGRLENGVIIWGKRPLFPFTMPWKKRRHRRLPHQGRFPKMVATCFIRYSSNTVIHLSMSAPYLRSPCLHSQRLNDHKLISKCWAHQDPGEPWAFCQMQNQYLSSRPEGWRMYKGTGFILNSTFIEADNSVEEASIWFVQREAKWGSQVHLVSGETVLKPRYWLTYGGSPAVYPNRGSILEGWRGKTEKGAKGWTSWH